MLKWVEVSRSALVNNLRSLSARLPRSASVMAVVKANAYGHGLRLAASAALEAGAAWLGVNEASEALELLDEYAEERAGGPAVLVLGAVEPSSLDELLGSGARLVVYSERMLEEIERAARRCGVRARLHIKLETGLNRQGVGERELPRFLERFASSDVLLLEGAYSHFADMEDSLDHSWALEQRRRFERMCSVIAEGGFRVLRHMGCSASALLFPRDEWDIFRVGISFYGLWPSRETRLSLSSEGEAFELEPALSWKCRVVQVKEVAAGEPVGYGRSAVMTTSGRLAVLPVGYYDGYDRALSNCGPVLIGGRRAFVKGRVAMNMIVVDVTHVPNVREGDEAVLIGRQGDGSVSADELASLVGTINYEIVTRINDRLPRIEVP